MRKKERKEITALLKKFAIREDREELVNGTEPRFKAELVDERKGTPTSYISKYVSKNIDGRGLSKEISKETGKTLKDSAEHVTAWASLHRIQQFRFFGIPGRQAYRELRLLAGQAARTQPQAKAGAPVLSNEEVDAVLAAADVGCFATYIMKQSGVLVPRKHHIVRTAYELNDEPSAYGDHGVRIYGVWSPLIDGRICTHAVKWKMVRKAVDVEEAQADKRASAPWTRGNNCPLVEKTNKIEVEKNQPEPGEEPIDLDNLTKKQQRELYSRLKQVGQIKRRVAKGYQQKITQHQYDQLAAELRARGFAGNDDEVEHLTKGGSFPSGGGLRIFYENNRLKEDDKWRSYLHLC